MGAESSPVRLMQTIVVVALLAACSGTSARSGGDGVKPGDDFYAFANAEWLAATPLPPGRSRWTWRDEVDVTTRKALVAVLDDATTRPAGSEAREVADFRAAYLDEATIERRGIAPLAPAFDGIARIRDRRALVRWLGRDLRADVDPLGWGVTASSHVFGLAVQRGIHGEPNHFAYLVQGGLGLKDPAAYADPSPKMATLRLAYRSYVAGLLRDAGFDRAMQRAEAVMSLETAIARTHATEADSTSERNADHHWTKADFARKAPGMDWSTFFAAAGLSQADDVVVWQPDAIAGEAALVGSQPLDAWKDYLRVRAIDRDADVLPRRFAQASLAMRATEQGGETTTREARAIEATDATDAAMPDAVGRLYVERYFPAETKARVQAIVADVMDAFGKRIEAVRWMSPATKATALAKLGRIYFGVGFPEHATRDAGLAIAPHDAFGNRRRVVDQAYRHALARLGEPVDATAWILPPQRVVAVYLPLQNAYNWPAALLQAPKFDPSASDATNYGAIGAVVGHEVSHYFDELGADYEANGNMAHWWSADDDAKFKAASEALVAQYSAYRPLPDLAIDGRLARSENIADLGGLVAAFDAYRRALGDKANDRETLRRSDREFFIGFARSWRVRMSDDGYRAKAATDHAPEDLRVATVRNLDAWYDAFDVVPGQALYLAPADRVVIW